MVFRRKIHHVVHWQAMNPPGEVLEFDPQRGWFQKTKRTAAGRGD